MTDAISAIPVVRDSIAVLTADGRPTRWEAVVAATGLGPEVVQTALLSLWGRGAIKGSNVARLDNPRGCELIDIRLVDEVATVW